MQDVLLDNNKEPVIVNGDFVIGNASYQNLSLILCSQAGEWRNHYRVGVGIRNYLKSDSTALREVVNDLQAQLERDGAIVRAIEVSQEGLNVDFDYL